MLAIVSRYGRVDGQGLYDFLDGTEIDLEEWTVPDLPDLDIDSWLDEFVIGGTAAIFQPGEEEAQGKLNAFSPALVKCPDCGHEFNGRGASLHIKKHAEG